MRVFLRLLGVCLLMLVPFFACMDFGSDEDQGSGCGPYNFTWGEPDPCRGVVCADDGDPCTVEYCSGGSCRSRPAEDGTVCTYDGLRGVCVEGICGKNLCEDVVCDEPCSSGFCDFADGLCHYEPRLADGTPCVSDGLEGVCVGGVCGENLCEEVVCDEEPCRIGVCSYVDGSCSYADNKPIGTPCVFEGNPGVCIDGICGENLCEGVDCDDGDACTDGTCDYRDGTCDFTSVVCADEEPCT